MLRPQRAAAGGAYRQRSGEEFKYQYDLNNRVTSSSAGDQWEYDNLGNVLEHRWRSGQDRFTINEYDAAEREGWDSLGPRAKAAAAANIAAQLSSNLSAGSVITLSPYLLVMDASDDTTLRTDYAYQRIGGKDGLSSGAVQYHTVQGGESLRALAHIYYGSPSYWYLVADANGLAGDEPVEAGRVLTIPGVIANSVNDKDTYKVYSESAIIGAESPAAKVKKKSSFMQKLVMVIIVVIIVWMAVVTAGAAAAAYGAVVAAGGTVVGGLVVAAAVGYAIGYATSYFTQTLAIGAGLQEGYDWKAMQKMGTSFAVSAVAPLAIDWVGSAYGATAAAAVRVSVAGAQQLASDGRITSWSSLLLAALPEGEKASETAQAIDTYRGTLQAGLAILEASARGDQDGMHWVDFAAAAIGDGVAGESGSGYYSSEGFNWSRIATETVINVGMAAVVGSRHGSDAGWSYFAGAQGRTMGSALGQATVRDLFTDTTRQGSTVGQTGRHPDGSEGPLAEQEHRDRGFNQLASLDGPVDPEAIAWGAESSAEEQAARDRLMEAAAVLEGGQQGAVASSGEQPLLVKGQTEPYRIQRGDTLSEIAVATGHSMEDLARWNGIDDPDRILAGDVLRFGPGSGVGDAQAPLPDIDRALPPVRSMDTRQELPPELGRLPSALDGVQSGRIGYPGRTGLGERIADARRGSVVYERTWGEAIGDVVQAVFGGREPFVTSDSGEAVSAARAQIGLFGDDERALFSHILNAPNDMPMMGDPNRKVPAGFEPTGVVIEQIEPPLESFFAGAAQGMMSSTLVPDSADAVVTGDRRSQTAHARAGGVGALLDIGTGVTDRVSNNVQIRYEIYEHTQTGRRGVWAQRCRAEQSSAYLAG